MCVIVIAMFIGKGEPKHVLNRQAPPARPVCQGKLFHNGEFRVLAEFRTGENAPFCEIICAAKSFVDQKTPIMSGKMICRSRMSGKQLG